MEIGKIAVDKRNPAMTLGDCLRVWETRTKSRVCNPKTIESQLFTAKSFADHWPLVPEFIERGCVDLRDVLPRKLDYDDVLAWRTFFRIQYSPDYTNRATCLLRQLFEIASEFGAFNRPNPVDRLAKCPIQKTVLHLPSQEQFDKFLNCLVNGVDNSHKKLMGHVRDWVEGIMFTGLRKTEASLVCARHVDLQQWELVLTPDMVKGGKRGRIIPIPDEAQALFTRLVADADPVTGKLFKVSDQSTSFDRACRQAGIKRLTVHKIRHYFATHIMEQTGNAKVVAALLGHSDGGKLALNTYTHERDGFVKQMVAKVKWRNLERKVAVGSQPVKTNETILSDE